MTHRHTCGDGQHSRNKLLNALFRFALFEDFLRCAPPKLGCIKRKRCTANVLLAATGTEEQTAPPTRRCTRRVQRYASSGSRASDSRTTPSQEWRLNSTKKRYI
ncbi:hypothetical protein R5R35_008026 [Gryllus longicercus]|uniref:Uncharacterized protein n=1 Tax=Gryllus longicercus TaxID=2509291 RepID=A0AAN9YYS8_9ORTH